ncbi:hypothetical protein LN736_01610 [Clostridium sp. WLY-B-L2]|jgi:hypothetical protein|uniref:Uncharacterized protein n=1 Tax=Clostridium aromativorans TaxID=2836848 RepID=A0ABS8N1B6_9CLOT|nr:hypothetical protein [Clostridium aromativorans]MCC9293571.1 hypothetical protein [Clostridium aromativorans]CAB1253596.1 conserved hypothetical protein [Clostridiaceae bacterium BL-3]
MSHRKIIEEYYCDINNLTDLLSKLTNCYRLLIGGAGELNSIASAHKKEVKDALHRVDELGDILDKLISAIDKSTVEYAQYCKMRTEIIRGKMKAQYMETEIDEELFLNNLDTIYDDNTKEE